MTIASIIATVLLLFGFAVFLLLIKSWIQSGREMMTDFERDDSEDDISFPIA